ncbi:hypothetical protein Misp01_13100 [Microtetraspora sp. NBRC 13810]|uniref:S8 family peptidase n=1 Tax=Microtetraspora sp. NBRC 13810 TaxID=3030990 RepID=UPI0024A3B5ED|nr:S8 family serine peptidase [Microtetraspora sp. NBRC 13810]GLW06180.1 hypothetical protein Misp01_13100 [Microtetraspora sp. NBRC 13810]
MRLRRLLACSLLLALVPVTPAMAQEPPGLRKLETGLAGGEAPARVIVELSDPSVAAPVAQEADELARTDVVLEPERQPFIVVEGTGDDLTELAADPRVVSIRRDRAYTPSLESSVKVIGADRAQAEGVTGTGQTIAVLDTGIDRDHPALAGRIVAEACFSATDEEGLQLESLCPNGQSSQIGEGAADAETPKCLDGTVNMCDHGTHVAGIAAGAAVPGSPGAGVAPGANIVAVQIFSRVNDPDLCGAAACLLAFDSTLRLAMDHVASLAATHRIAAVNLSLGGGLSDVACDDAEEAQDLKPGIDALLAQGVATVVAAGNEFFDGTAYPACISTAVAVGATDDDDTIAPFSNSGPLLDLFAPGVNIDSAIPDDAYTGYSGTSMAAPHVAGALALLKQKFPDRPVQELIDLLKSSGRQIHYGAAVTPRVDVYAALTGGAPAPPVTQPPPANPDEPGDQGAGGDDRETGEPPVPSPTTEPVPSPPPAEPPAPVVPLPAVTVTVTVTVTPTPPAPTTAPQVCTRGTAKKGLTAARWASEMGTGKGTLTDRTLGCYLSLVKKASDVFPEVAKLSTPASAARILAAKARATSKAPVRTSRAALDRELLAAWLNWAHGARNITAKVNGSATLKAVLATAEGQRLGTRTNSAQYTRSAVLLQTRVNK